MKNLFQFVIVLIFTSCTGGISNKPTIVDETFNPNQDSLFIQCADLKGLDEFIIGKTTFKQAVNSKYYRDLYDWQKHSSLYNGYWGVAKNASNHDKSEWLEKNAKSIKQFPNSGYDFKIGDLKFSAFDLAFYDDILVAIYFKIDDSKVHRHYIEKYGNGRGSNYYYDWSNGPCSNPEKLRYKTIAKEDRVWENNDVQLIYHLYYNSEKASNSSDITYIRDSYYLLSSKRLYQKFIDELSRWDTEYEVQRAQKESQILNQL